MPKQQLPSEVLEALKVLSEHKAELQDSQYVLPGDSSGFNLRNYLQLDHADKFQVPMFPTHTRMERTIPGVGTVPFFGVEKPPVYREYPAMRYSPDYVPGGVVGMATVMNAHEDQKLKESGEWYDHPDEIPGEEPEPVQPKKRRKATDEAA